jgi:exopolysaccharide biosynthesis operon protein EpsL
MRSPRRLRDASSLVLLTWLSSAPAWAQEPPALTISGGYSVQTDSNLFRLPAGANTLALIGKSTGAETIGVTTLGLGFNTSYSLQRLELDLNLINYQYKNNDYLSFTAENYRAAWRWALTPRFTGTLSSDRQESLNSFSDSTNLTQRNLRTNTSTVFNAVYEIDGPWRLLGGFARTAQTNELAVLTESDFRANSANAGVRYVFASGSQVTYQLKTTSGSYLNRTPSPSSLLDDSYHQTDNTVSARWLLDGKTTADLSAAYIQRTHPNYSQRDYSGVNASASVNWAMTAKTSLNASWARELANYQTSTTNTTLTQRLTLAPAWQISTKVVARLSYECAQRDYQDSPGALPSSTRSDTLRDTTLSIGWQPYRQTTFTAALGRSTRSSNQDGLDYDSDSATLSAQFSF